MLVLNSIFLISLLFLQIVFGVDVDYYDSTALRSQTLSLSCKNRLQQMYCQFKCKMKSAFCIQNDCYCLSFARPNVVPETQIDDLIADLHKENDYEDNEPPTDTIPIVSPESDQAHYALRPTLRHHIAHFCPNLDVARECIKKCMLLGKPAFCGKDHVCYCGHRYSNHDDDTNSNVKDIYGQFRDLYKKYFGNDATFESIELE